MNKSSLREIKFSTVFIAVLILGIAAAFSSSSASQDNEDYEIIQKKEQ